MQRLQLVRQIARAAADRGVGWELVRQGARHELWRCGDLQVTVPRHREINEVTAESIRKFLEPELGEGWWQH